MNFRTNLRASSARWAAPFAVGLALFYYFGNGMSVTRAASHYAPALASAAISTVYAVAYAVAAGLAVWEGGHVSQSGVWALAPARSRYRIALNALTPSLLLAWLMLLLPVCLALLSAGAVPTPRALGPLGMALLLCCAHSVIGFAVGTRLNRVIAAPVLAVVVWVAVAFSWATDTFWLRHVLGQYPTDMDYGEAASFQSLCPHLLLTGGLALAVATLWTPIRHAAPRIFVALAIAVAGPALAYRMAADWGPNPPLLAGQVDMRCVGQGPRVCMPEGTTAAELTQVRNESVSVITALSRAGVRTDPDLITDRIVYGRFGHASTADTWQISLTQAVHQDAVRYHVLAAAVRFPCSRPDTTKARPAMLWAADVTHQAAIYQRRMASEDDPNVDSSPRALAAMAEKVKKVRHSPPSAQARWFKTTVSSACVGAR